MRFFKINSNGRTAMLVDENEIWVQDTTWHKVGEVIDDEACDLFVDAVRRILKSNIKDVLDRETTCGECDFWEENEANPATSACIRYKAITGVSVCTSFRDFCSNGRKKSDD